MLIIQEKLISGDVIQEQFICNLTACKGACCWQGEWGAPLEDKELEILEKIYEAVAPLLSEEGRKVIEEKGKHVYHRQPAENRTPLMNNGACAYMTKNELGMAKCGIEQAYLAGEIEFKKPISCHLYPIRAKKDPRVIFEQVNYDRWDICSAACTLGKKEAVPVYRFLKEAIIRKYGAEFYDQLDQAAQHLKKPE